MNNTLNKLSVWFEEKGLMQQEFPFFVNDVIRFIDKEGHATLQSLNQELEALGWGVQLMDETTYNHLLFLHRHKISLS
jgi:hypothetical protein